MTLYVEGGNRFKTKKALKEAVATGKAVYVYSESPFSDAVTGRHAICGPTPHQRKWYAEVEVDEHRRVVRVIA